MENTLKSAKVMAQAANYRIYAYDMELTFGVRFPFLNTNLTTKDHRGSKFHTAKQSNKTKKIPHSGSYQALVKIFERLLDKI